MGKELITRKRVYGGTKTPDVLSKPSKEAFKAYQKDKSEEQHCAYKEANEAAKRAVAMTKEEAYEELYTKLDTREGAKIIYKLAKSRDRSSRDLSDIAYVKDGHGTILTESGKIKERWKQNFDKVFNAENPREQLDELPTTEGPVECFSLDEVKKQMVKMGKGIACGPDELLIEAVHIILDCKPECIVEAFSNILRTNKMPKMTGERAGWYLYSKARVMYWNATTTEVYN